MKTAELHIRDPYILVKDGKYYLYRAIITEKPEKVVVYISEDLKNWSNEKTVYTLCTNGWKSEDIWAPEVHEYCGKFYIFLSVKSKNGLRGTEISVSDRPDGEFSPIADRPATPLDKCCIDGTLFVDDKIPYIVYSHNWPNNYVEDKGAYVGQIWGQQLSKDLKKTIGEAFLIFNSDESPYSAKFPSREFWGGKNLVRYGSDGPFITKLSSGELFMTWSPYCDGNYVILGAVANDIRGPWRHIDKPLFDRNGGHAMVFTALDGQRKICLHCPEEFMKERALISDVEEQNGELVITRNND